MAPARASSSPGGTSSPSPRRPRALPGAPTRAPRAARRSKPPPARNPCPRTRNPGALRRLLVPPQRRLVLPRRRREPADGQGERRLERPKRVRLQRALGTRGARCEIRSDILFPRPVAALFSPLLLGSAALPSTSASTPPASSPSRRPERLLRGLGVEHAESREGPRVHRVAVVAPHLELAVGFFGAGPAGRGRGPRAARGARRAATSRAAPPPPSAAPDPPRRRPPPVSPRRVQTERHPESPATPSAAWSAPKSQRARDVVGLAAEEYSPRSQTPEWPRTIMQEEPPPGGTRSE